MSPTSRNPRACPDLEMRKFILSPGSNLSLTCNTPPPPHTSARPATLSVSRVRQLRATSYKVREKILPMQERVATGSVGDSPIYPSTPFAGRQHIRGRALSAAFPPQSPVVLSRISVGLVHWRLPFWQTGGGARELENIGALAVSCPMDDFNARRQESVLGKVCCTLVFLAAYQESRCLSHAMRAEENVWRPTVGAVHLFLRASLGFQPAGNGFFGVLQQPDSVTARRALRNCFTAWHPFQFRPTSKRPGDSRMLVPRPFRTPPSISPDSTS